MSKMPLALLLAVLSVPAFAGEPLTSEQALENYRTKLVAPPRCPTSVDPEDIVVCGSRVSANAHRLPLPVGPMPGDRVHGEAISTVAAGDMREDCSPVGRTSSCGGLIPILAVALVVAKVVDKAIIHPED